MESEQISLLSSETEKNKPEDTFLSFFSLFQQELSQEHDQKDTYRYSPGSSGNQCSVFLYDRMFCRLKKLKTKTVISFPEWLLANDSRFPFQRPEPKGSENALFFDFVFDQRFESVAFLDWSKLKKKEIFRALGDTSFACCSAFVRCSDARECLHQTDIYYNHCYYRENLEAGRIFYGKNKNI